MKIWIDLINTPQVSFFSPFIKDFEKEDHEILITCRDSGNTVNLLQQRNLKFYIIGAKATNWKYTKYYFFLLRIFKLYSFIKNNKVDVAVSQSSFYQPVVSKLLNIPCLYTNDNEHAKGNLFGFLFAKKVFLPIALSNEKFVKQWPLKSKVNFYPSVKEAIYLSQDEELLHNSSEKRTIIYFRPEPRTALYYKGPVNFFDNILLKLMHEYEVIVLPRDKNQQAHYMQEKFSKLKVAREPISLKKIVSNCLLFIGAGGSMSRELAVLGIPVISIYQEEMLCVDKYLFDKKRMIINPDITYEELKTFLALEFKKSFDYSDLKNGEKSYMLVRQNIESIKKEPC